MASVERNDFYNGKSAGYQKISAREAKPPKESFVVIYGRRGCGYTEKAVKMGRAILCKRVTFYDMGECRDKVVGMLKKMYPNAENHMTIPLVFVDGSFVGGASEFEEYIRVVGRMCG